MSGSATELDVRVPMGLMFFLLGAVLAIYGVVSNNDANTYKASLGININLWWGLVILAFGALMLILAWRGRRKKAVRVVGPSDR